MKIIGLDQTCNRATAKNVGLRAAKGAYVTVLDAGDVLSPDYLSVVVSALRGGEVDRVKPTLGCWLTVGAMTPHGPVGCGVSWTDDGTDHWTALRVQNLAPSAACVWPRALFDVLDGFDESLGDLEDWDFWLRARAHVGAQHAPDGVVTVARWLWHRAARPGIARAGLFVPLRQMIANRAGRRGGTALSAADFASAWLYERDEADTMDADSADVGMSKGADVLRRAAELLVVGESKGAWDALAATALDGDGALLLAGDAHLGMGQWDQARRFYQRAFSAPCWVDAYARVQNLDLTLVLRARARRHAKSLRAA